MNILELLLILFFGFLIISHVFSYFYKHFKSYRIMEGLENANNVIAIQTPSTYDEYIGLQNTDPLFLAIKNAANISFLKSQIDDISNVREEINKLNSDVQANNTQIEAIQQSLVSDLNPPDEDNEETGEEGENMENLTEVIVSEETENVEV